MASLTCHAVAGAKRFRLERIVRARHRVQAGTAVGTVVDTVLAVAELDAKETNLDERIIAMWAHYPRHEQPIRNGDSQTCQRDPYDPREVLG